MTSNYTFETPTDAFPLLYFWLGKEAEQYEEFETLEDYAAHIENEEMKALGY